MKTPDQPDPKAPAWTKGPWRVEHKGGSQDIVAGDDYFTRTFVAFTGAGKDVPSEANATLIASAPDLYEALSLHQAWADSEKAGPNYGAQTRDTHPDGERIWRQWWDSNLDLCDRAQCATKAALSRARGEQP